MSIKSLKDIAALRKRGGDRLVTIDLAPMWTFFETFQAKREQQLAEALRRIQAAFDSLRRAPEAEHRLQPRRIIANFGFGGDFEIGEDVTPRIEFALRLVPGEIAKPIQAFINATTPPSGGDLILDCYYSTDPFDTAVGDREWFPLFPDLTAAEVLEAILDTNHYKLILPEDQEIREFPVVIFKNPTDDEAVVPELHYSALLRCDVIAANGASVGVAKIVFEVSPATEGVPDLGLV